MSDITTDSLRRFVEGRLDCAKRAAGRNNKVGIARPLKVVHELAGVLSPAEKKMKALFRDTTEVNEVVEGVRHGETRSLRKVSDELLEYVREKHPDLIVETVDKKEAQKRAGEDPFLKIIVERDMTISEPITFSKNGG